MLRAAVEVKLAEQKKVRDDILWLLDKVDHMLSAKRNNAIHSAVIIQTGVGGATVTPYELAKNPRAAALKGKDIVAELVWYRDTAIALRKYSSALFRAIATSGEYPWPQRPALPPLSPQTKGKGTPQANSRIEP
jgi:hypothetical protein